MPPLPQPMYHARQNIWGNFVSLRECSEIFPSIRQKYLPPRGGPGGLPHMPNLAGVGQVCVHVRGESQVRFRAAVPAPILAPDRILVH